MPMNTPSALGGIMTSVASSPGIGSSAFPTLTNLTPGPASSTFPTAAMISSSDATASLTAPTNANRPGLIPGSISVSGTTYVYVGCFEGQYIQSIVASYTVGSVNQCASFCLGSIYFSLGAGDECERLIILKTERNH